jgi:hypothetical protein
MQNPDPTIDKDGELRTLFRMKEARNYRSTSRAPHLTFFIGLVWDERSMKRRDVEERKRNVFVLANSSQGEAQRH